MTKQEFFEKNGFSTDGITYCIVGENTFSIKDTLKEVGCKYSPLLKWHIDHKINLPAGFKLVTVNFEKIYAWNDESGGYLQLSGAKSFIDELLRPTPAQNYEYMGVIGVREYEVPVTFVHGHSFNSQYGYTNIYVFITLDKNYKIIWFTEKELNLKEGQKLFLTGTVKDHRVYQGENTTIMNRCIIKKEE